MQAHYPANGQTPPPSPTCSGPTVYNPMKLENILAPRSEISIDMEAARALYLLKSSPGQQRRNKLPSPRDSMEPENRMESFLFNKLPSISLHMTTQLASTSQFPTPTGSISLHKSSSRSPTPPVLAPRTASNRVRRPYRPNTPPSSSSSSSSSSTSSSSAQNHAESRDRREEYEEEELAFIAYLMCRERVRNTTTWGQRLNLFHQRFPVGQKRRSPRPGMSEIYGRRTIQGLQSKWYRKEKQLKRMFNQHESEELDRRAADSYGPELATKYGFEEDMVDIWARL